MTNFGFYQYSLDGITKEDRVILSDKLKNKQILHPSTQAVIFDYGSRKWLASCTNQLYQVHYSLLLLKLGLK